MTSAATVAVAACPNRPVTGAPTISGTAQVGETLAADVSAIAEADGLSNAVYEYWWLVGGLVNEITGANGSASRR